MKLHLNENKTAFKTLIDQLNEKTGLRADIIEKDYYVTLMLKELSHEQYINNLPAYFKGGTALYKALKSINRFSEDIDLTVNVENLTNTQKKKTLEKSVKKYSSLHYLGDENNVKGSITSLYSYDSIYSVDLDDLDDRLQRFGNIKVEGTSFTISEPIIEIEISPELYDKSSEDFKEILENEYDVKPFFIKVISMDRIFVDKVFASEYYFIKTNANGENMYFDVAKHLYDLTVLLKNKIINENLFNNIEGLTYLIELKRKEEKNRYGSSLSNKHFSDFTYFNEISSNYEFAAAYDKMQEIYVLHEEDNIEISEIYNTVNILRNIFISL